MSRRRCSTGKLNDLTGIVFGRLTVISPTDERGADGSVKWLCRCKCGNTIIASANNLRRGITKSCGCYRTERIIETSKKYNEFIINDNICRCVTGNGDTFIIDSEDLDKIKKYYWYKNDQGYIVTNTGNNKFIRLHRLILGVSKNEIVDHKNRDKTDNRKSNLRIANKQLNGINRAASKTSSTGVKGVSRSANGKKYIARICKDGKTIYIGIYPSIKEAYLARYKKEVELFGEFAYEEVVD